MQPLLEFTPAPPVLRVCQAAVESTLRLTALVERQSVVAPDDAPPEAVRADAELRALAHALQEQAEPVAAELARRLRRPGARRGTPRARPSLARRPAAP